MLHKANWPTFQRKVELLLTQTNITGEINEMAHTMTDIVVWAANDHIPKTASKSRISMYWCYDISVQAAKRLLNRAIKRFRARKDDNNKQAMHEAGGTYEAACNLTKNTSCNKWITEVNNCITLNSSGGKSRDPCEQMSLPRSTQIHNRSPTGSSRALLKDQLRHSY